MLFRVSDCKTTNNSFYRKLKWIKVINIYQQINLCNAPLAFFE